jgi:hypothetical protein
MPPDVVHDSAPCSHMVRGMEEPPSPANQPYHVPSVGMDELSPPAGNQASRQARPIRFTDSLPPSLETNHGTNDPGRIKRGRGGFKIEPHRNHLLQNCTTTAPTTAVNPTQPAAQIQANRHSSIQSQHQPTNESASRLGNSN